MKSLASLMAVCLIGGSCAMLAAPSYAQTKTFMLFTDVSIASNLFGKATLCSSDYCINNAFTQGAVKAQLAANSVYSFKVYLSPSIAPHFIDISHCPYLTQCYSEGSTTSCSGGMGDFPMQYDDFVVHIHPQADYRIAISCSSATYLHR